MQTTSDQCFKRKKSFHHSSTFYRKLNKIKGNSIPSNGKNISPQIESTLSTEIDTADVQTIDLVNTWEDEEYLQYDSEQENDIILPNLRNELREWALINKISHSSVNSLLRILRNTAKITCLPLDCRTLLETPKDVLIVEMGNGHFWYNGVKRNILNIYSNIKENQNISLIFNVDGVPPFNNSQIEFWPILCRIENISELQPIVIGIYCGYTKPPLSDFLKEFIYEMQDILKNGVTCNGCQINVKIKYFVCDTPARSFIKGTVGFNSYSSCLKCTCTGEYDRKGRHMSFSNINCPIRTDYSFRNKLDEDHHKYTTPLLDLPINMVEDIIIADSLHLLDLGIMRKCLHGWIYGSYNFKSKLSSRQINLLSDALEECNSRKPSEIHRKIRSIKCLKHWKGSEFHVFLCYLGIVILKDVIPHKLYIHYLVLTCAVTILSCNKYLHYMHLAEELIKDYIRGYIANYGHDSISSNVHNLCHITNDVKKFGNLSNINTYPFENCLGQLKQLLRTGNKPLQQMAKRVGELEKINTFKTTCTIPSKALLKHEVLNEKHNLTYCIKVFKTFEFGEKFKLSNNLKDKWFLTKDNKIIEMYNGTYFNDKIFIYGAEISEKEIFFEKPIKSSYLNIYQSNGVLRTPELFSIDNIQCKLFSLKYNFNLVFIPLIHTLDLNIV